MSIGKKYFILCWNLDKIRQKSYVGLAMPGPAGGVQNAPRTP